MLGTVTTSFHYNEPEVSLPNSSHFLGAGDTIAQRATGQAGPKGCPVQAFADSIVDDIMGKSGMIWRGPYSTNTLVCVQMDASMAVGKYVVDLLERLCADINIQDYLLSYQQGLDNLDKA